MVDTQQVQPVAYRLLAGDELGVLRVVEVPAGPKWDCMAQVQKWAAVSKDQAITCITCSCSELDTGATALVAVGRKRRCVEIRDAQTGQQQASITAAAPSSAAPSTISQVHVTAVRFAPTAVDEPLQLVAATSDGMISICSCSSSTSSSTSSSSSHENGSSSSWVVSRSFQAGGSVLCMDLDSDGRHLLVGGEGVQPSIWELATGIKLWQAKGGKPNRQTLLVDKPYTTALAFLPSSSSNSSPAAQPAAAANGATAAGVQWRFLAGSANAKIAVYDPAIGKRPQCGVVFGGETRVTALAPEHTDGTRVWAANGMGSIQLLDLKTNKLIDALKGAGGSVRSLALHPSSENLLGSVGLDRFLRVHDTFTKASVGRIYLKQQLTAVCWLPVEPSAATFSGVEQDQQGTGARKQQKPEEEADEEQQQRQPSRKKKKKVKRREDDDQCAPAMQQPAGRAGKS